ncbi:MAG: hypothetical protein U0264_07390 [Candidatus Kapaibacterium sp.]
MALQIADIRPEDACAVGADIEIIAAHTKRGDESIADAKIPRRPRVTTVFGDVDAVAVGANDDFVLGCGNCSDDVFFNSFGGRIDRLAQKIKGGLRGLSEVRPGGIFASFLGDLRDLRDLRDLKE